MSTKIEFKKFLKCLSFKAIHFIIKKFNEIFYYIYKKYNIRLNFKKIFNYKL